jgi:subtilisin family serine protease
MAAQTVADLGVVLGTECAGSASAVFNNNWGTAGLAPNCHLLGARLPNPATGIEMADAFIWAAGFNTGNTTPGFPPLPARAADVISNSWGANGVVMSAALRDCFDFLTVHDRGGRGCVTTFSLGNNGHVPFATGTARRDYAAYERNIAVGASINTNPTNPIATSFHAAPNGATTNIATAVDTRALYSPFGPALDIVAPSHTAHNAAGNVIDATTSTTRVGLGPLDGCPGVTVCNDYGTNFGGTSHSSPTIAGAAALVLSVNAGLSWVQVREILSTSPLLTNHSLLARQRDARTHRTRCYHHLHDCSGGGNSSLVERIVGE